LGGFSVSDGGARSRSCGGDDELPGIWGALAGRILFPLRFSRVAVVLGVPPVGDAVWMVSSYLLLFCERVGLWGIPLGAWLVRVAGFSGDGGLLFWSLVVWPAMADLFHSYFVKVTTDERSMVLMRLVVDWALRFAALPMLGVPCRDGRWWINEVVEETNRNLEWGKSTVALGTYL